MTDAAIPRPYLKHEVRAVGRGSTEVPPPPPVPSELLLQEILDQIRLLEESQVRVYGAKRILSLTQLAEESGISLSHLSKVMRRTRLPSLPVALRLAQAMGCSLDELVIRLGLGG